MNMQDDFYRELINKLEDYKSALKNVGFAAYELSRIKMPEDEKELLDALDVIINSSIELNYILDEAPNSFVVSDEN